MELFHLFSILLIFVAGFAYINYRYIKLPTAIGLMLMALILSLVLIVVGYFIPSVKDLLVLTLEKVDFSSLVLDFMLSFMLFAGAIHIRFEDLKQESLSIVTYSTMSVLISTFLIGTIMFYMLPAFGLQQDYIYCLLFGSLISPTDPIAVISILKKAGVNKSLETKIAGESLFNDGVAVVVFLTIFELAQSGQSFNLSETALLFLKEAGGGIVLGLVFGYTGYKLISSIDNYQVEVIITLAVCMGGYTVAHFLHISGPLAMVIAGLITGNHGKVLGMSDETADYIDKFWELVDEILNAVLFVLIGLELIILDLNPTVIVIGQITIFIALGARYISLVIPSLLIRFKEKIEGSTLKILTWGGLRGGISIALALSLTETQGKSIWLTITYIVVCFAILVQGLTIGKVSKKLLGDEA